MSERCDILIVGQTPPPFHGQAVVTDMLFKHDWAGLWVERLRVGYSDDMSSVGSASWVKCWRLVCLVVSTWAKILTTRPKVLYYLPASPNLNPVLRDIAYLAAVRCFFPKVIFHYHAGGLDEYIESNKWLGWLAEFVYQRPDCAIDVNETTPPSGRYFGAKRDVVVMNGVDVGEATRKQASDQVFTLLYVGLLCEEKGVLDLVKTAQHLKAQAIDFEMVMVGGWESDDFQNLMMAQLDEGHVTDDFVFKGVLNGKAKWQEYADADVFLFSSRHPTETFGLVLVEAMAFGLPIVTTRWRGIPNVVGEDGCAILCEAGNHREYADAIVKLASDPSLRAHMGKQARQRYTSKFTRECFLGNMDKVFVDLLRTV